MTLLHKLLLAWFHLIFSEWFSKKKKIQCFSIEIFIFSCFQIKQISWVVTTYEFISFLEIFATSINWDALFLIKCQSHSQMTLKIHNITFSPLEDSINLKAITFFISQCGKTNLRFVKVLIKAFKKIHRRKKDRKWK